MDAANLPNYGKTSKYVGRNNIGKTVILGNQLKGYQTLFDKNLFHTNEDAIDLDKKRSQKTENQFVRIKAKTEQTKQEILKKVWPRNNYFRQKDSLTINVFLKITTQKKKKRGNYNTTEEELEPMKRFQSSIANFSKKRKIDYSEELKSLGKNVRIKPNSIFSR